MNRIPGRFDHSIIEAKIKEEPLELILMRQQYDSTMELCKQVMALNFAIQNLVEIIEDSKSGIKSGSLKKLNS